MTVRRHLILVLALLAPGATLPAQDAALVSAARQLSLQEALTLAEGESETVGIARADVARAEGERRRARSGYYPQLNGLASYQRTLQSQFSAFQEDTEEPSGPPPPQCSAFVPQPGSVEQRLDSLESAVACASNADPFAQFSELPFGRANTFRFGLSFSQVLFTGGRLKGQTQSANAGVRSAEFGLTSARAQLLLDVTSAYYDASLADRLVTIAEETLRQADTTLSQTQLARQVGNQSEFDLLRARVTRDNQRPVVIRRRSDRDLAHYRLKQLLNLPLEQPLALTTGLGDTALATAPQVDALIETLGDTAGAARLPVRQAEEGVQSQAGQLRVARAQRWPQVTLYSDYAQLGYPDNVDPFSPDYLSDWTVTLGAQVPLFTGGRLKGDVAVANANLQQAQLRLQQTRERAEVDARNADLQLASAVAAWRASAGTEEQAGRAYEIAEVRYREGLSTQTELNDSRIQLAQAQVTRAQAARDLQIARMRLALLPALPLEGAAPGPGGAGPAETTTQPSPYEAPPSPSRTSTVLSGSVLGGTISP
jgi:outer membrane protein TolC